MCQICETDAENYGEILPGWFLYKAKKDSEFCGRYEVSANEWFLSAVSTGDGTVIWKDEDEKESINLFNNGTYGQIHSITWCEPEQGYSLVLSAMKMGFNPKSNFNLWFLEKLIEFRKTHQNPSPTTT